MLPDENRRVIKVLEELLEGREVEHSGHTYILDADTKDLCRKGRKIVLGKVPRQEEDTWLKMHCLLGDFYQIFKDLADEEFFGMCAGSVLRGMAEERTASREAYVKTRKATLR